VWLIASLALTLVLVPLCIRKEAYDDLIIILFADAVNFICIFIFIFKIIRREKILASGEARKEAVLAAFEAGNSIPLSQPATIHVVRYSDRISKLFLNVYINGKKIGLLPANSTLTYTTNLPVNTLNTAINLLTKPANVPDWEGVVNIFRMQDQKGEIEIVDGEVDQHRDIVIQLEAGDVAVYHCGNKRKKPNPIITKAGTR